jgi:UDP-N-acetylglucosamine 2-epimerase (non-hydrolysing)
MSLRILSIVGTRPEAIKMAPVVEALGACPQVQSTVCVTGQHREMLDQVLTVFGIEPEFDLNVMRRHRKLSSLVRAVMGGVDRVIDEVRPDRVLVHGDTSTAMAAAVAAFNRRVPVGHVEAGMRTHNPGRPWPEEFNRKVIDVGSDLLFAPTLTAKRNLLAESTTGRVVVTGNTVIDALNSTVQRLNADAKLRAKLDRQAPDIGEERRLILVTGHRRENLGEGLASVCQALVRLAERGDVEIVYVLHLNPRVRGPVRRMLQGREHIHLAPPQSYLSFVRLMQRAFMVITDSGGVQEEAPVLGTPVLVTRTETERPETVEIGASQLVGPETQNIVAAAERLLDDRFAYRSAKAVRSPYGDGRAAARIVSTLLGEAVDEFEEPARPADLRKGLIQPIGVTARARSAGG